LPFLWVSGIKEAYKGLLNGDILVGVKRGTGETQKRRANTEIAKHFDQTFFKFDDTACLSGV